MSGIIEHIATVIAVDNGRVDVEIAVQEACHSCKAKGLCGVESDEHRVVSVFTEYAAAYRVGETVMVQAAQSIGIKAAVYAYVIPFFLLFLCLFAMVECGVSESVSGLCSLGAVALYYMVLALMRKKFEREIIFKLKKL